MTRRDAATFYAARRLFTFPSQPHLAVAACGLLSLGHGELRSITVLMDGFSAEVDTQTRLTGNVRISTAMFAAQLGAYLSTVWKSCMLPEDKETLDLVVAGIDLGMPYGVLYSLQVPNSLTPVLHRPLQQTSLAKY
jgi:hypothetical protein